ncbi:hypothetical protein MMC17_008654 [Xylographa soralifera]|nr:hypothetical protein [Xylographa soralifera]
MSFTSPVLIMGTGVSGLAFAQGLLKANIPFRLFERDSALNLRSQGYRVRINEVGIAALTSVLTPELYLRLEATCAHTATGGHNGVGPLAVLNALTGQESERPQQFGRGRPKENVDPLTVDRTVLRSVLSRGLEDYVEFGKEFLSYQKSPMGVAVRFSDGCEVQGSLLVGADGARSRVKRQLVPEDALVDTEGRWVYGKTTLTPELTEKFNEVSLKGLTVIQDHTKGLPFTLLLEPVRFKDNEFRSELPEDYIYWVLGSRKDIIGMDDTALMALSAEEAAVFSQKITSHWHPSFHPLFALQDAAQTSILRIASARPEIAIWDSSNSVTLIGDAIHVMSPSAGVGATTALRDAAMLSQILRDEGLSAQSLGKYEATMRQYAGEAIEMSVMGGKFLFGMQSFEELKPLDVLSKQGQQV